MRRLYYLSHADVIIDPAVPVTDWGLSARGVARHEAFAARCPPLAAIWSSRERKAWEGAAPLAARQGLEVMQDTALHENDRSATGYLPSEAFEAMADAFFAAPEQNVRGWERAVDAQARTVAALHRLVATVAVGDLAVVGHGGVGALLRAHLLGAPIDRSHDQPPGGGGHVMVVALPDWRLTQDWTRIEEWQPQET